MTSQDLNALWSLHSFQTSSLTESLQNRVGRARGAIKYMLLNCNNSLFEDNEIFWISLCVLEYDEEFRCCTIINDGIIAV